MIKIVLRDKNLYHIDTFIGRVYLLSIKILKTLKQANS